MEGQFGDTSNQPTGEPRADGEGGVTAGWSGSPVPERFLQPQGPTERSEKRRDLFDGDKRWIGPRQPASGPLFCMTMEKALKRLESEYPEMKHTGHQDDVYFVVAPDKTEEVLNTIWDIWEK